MSQSPVLPPLDSLGLPKPIDIPSKQPPAMAMHELQHLEKIVKDGKNTFVNVGMALLQIRDGRGYKLRGFHNFEEYCDKTFELSRRHAYRLMEAIEMLVDIKTVSNLVTIENENQAREVKKAGIPQVVEKVKEALEKAGGDPAKALKNVLREEREKRAAEKPKVVQPRLVPHEDAEPERPDDREFETTVRSNAPPAVAERPFMRCYRCGLIHILDHPARVVEVVGEENRNADG